MRKAPERTQERRKRRNEPPVIMIWLFYRLTMKARTVDVVFSVTNWIYAKCYQVENVVTKNWINIPVYESYRLLAQMYAKDLVDTIEQNDGSYFVLKESGTDLCKKYLI